MSFVKKLYRESITTAFMVHPGLNPHKARGHSGKKKLPAWHVERKYWEKPDSISSFSGWLTEVPDLGSVLPFELIMDEVRLHGKPDLRSALLHCVPDCRGHGLHRAQELHPQGSACCQHPGQQGSCVQDCWLWPGPCHRGQRVHRQGRWVWESGCRRGCIWLPSTRNA